jgi:glycosyltransferase involved in cell wall biosynthesis
LKIKTLKEIAKNIPGRMLDSLRRENASFDADKISIGVTTFGNRFDRYFVPLLSKLKDYVPENEIIVAINGEHQQEFNESYRNLVLEFISRHKKVYPIIFPHFRGLSKLWNSIIINATHDYILMINDDIMINDPFFMNNICSAIKKNKGRSFLINKSWSHFLIDRAEIDELGYFDERLLGIGEEDGDMTWRYLSHFGREISIFKMKCFINYAEETVSTYKPTNIKCHSGSKYSLFNREFMFAHKYHLDPAGIKGMFDEPVIMKDPGKEQYPNERFYRLHKKDL